MNYFDGFQELKEREQHNDRKLDMMEKEFANAMQHLAEQSARLKKIERTLASRENQTTAADGSS